MVYWFLIVCVLAGLVAFYLRSSARRSRYERLCALFGVDSSEWRLLGSDLGGSEDKLFLRGDGLVGVPDALFASRDGSRVLVGEAKVRHFKARRGRPRVRPYERFQVQLYMGLAARRYRCQVQSIIRYGDGFLVPVDADPEEYRYLLTLRAPFRRATRKMSSRSVHSPSASGALPHR